MRWWPEQGATSAGTIWVSPRARSWAGAATLWALVGLGALGGLWSAVSRPAPRAAVAAAAPSPVGPSGFAQLFVDAYLPAGQENTASLASFMADPPGLADVTAGRLAATSTTALDATVVSPGYWTVEVAAQVEELDRSGQWDPLGVRFYRVGVIDRGGRYVATSLPEEVAGPAVASAPPSPGGDLTAPGDGLEPSTVAQFLGALLAGQGQLSRYVPVGSPLRAIAPPPFSQVTVTGEAVTPVPGTKGTRSQVVAQVSATDRAGQTEELAYTLRLSVVAGQWEVTDVLGAAPISTKQ